MYRILVVLAISCAWVQARIVAPIGLPLAGLPSCGACGLPFECGLSPSIELSTCGCLKSVIDSRGRQSIVEVGSPNCIKIPSCGCGSAVEVPACGCGKLGCGCGKVLSGCGCGVPNCGCNGLVKLARSLAGCNCGVSPCSCSGPISSTICGCGVSPCGCGLSSCGSCGLSGCGSCGLPSCGCGSPLVPSFVPLLSTIPPLPPVIGCEKYLRQVCVQPPFL